MYVCLGISLISLDRKKISFVAKIIINESLPSEEISDGFKFNCKESSDNVKEQPF